VGEFVKVHRFRGSEVQGSKVQRFRVQGSEVPRSKVDEIVKSARSVIPGLTRNPELIEITGFPLSRE
jgi:hypothetical protein